MTLSWACVGMQCGMVGGERKKKNAHGNNKGGGLLASLGLEGKLLNGPYDKEKGLNGRGGGRRRHKQQHKEASKKEEVNDDVDLLEDLDTMHNIFGQPGDWRHRRATTTEEDQDSMFNMEERRELYPTDSFPQQYTYEAKLYIEINQDVIDTNGGEGEAFEYVNALITAASATFEEEVDTHCKLQFLFFFWVFYTVAPMISMSSCPPLFSHVSSLPHSGGCHH